MHAGGKPAFCACATSTQSDTRGNEKKSFGYSKIISSSSSFLPGPPPPLTLISPPSSKKRKKTNKQANHAGPAVCFVFRNHDIYVGIIYIHFITSLFFYTNERVVLAPNPPLPSCKGKPKTGGGGSQMNQAAARSMKRNLKRGGELLSSSITNPLNSK